MDKHIGFDVDSKKTVACVVQKGEKDRYTTFKTDIGQMKSFLQRQRRQGEKLNLTFEVSGQSGYLSDSRSASSNWLLRHRYKQEVRIPNKQLLASCFNNRSTLQVSLANRNLLQMDQTLPSNQNIFRPNRERGEDSNLDCHQRLCPGRNCQERTPNQAEFERNLANSQHYHFRTSADGTSAYEKYLAKSNSWAS